MKAGEYTITFPLTDHQSGVVQAMLLHAELENGSANPGAIFLQVGKNESGEILARGGFLPNDKAASVKAIISGPMGITEIKALNLCHDCRKVFSGTPEFDHPGGGPSCPACGSGRMCMLLDMEQIVAWKENAE